MKITRGNLVTAARIQYINAVTQELGLTGKIAIPPRATERAEIKRAAAASRPKLSLPLLNANATTAPIEIRGSNGI